MSIPSRTHVAGGRTDGYTQHDTERWAHEDSKSRNRTAFERDRARVVHSSALRRLGAKTQILVAGTDDFARTRLTHTLEVAQIGRQIAEIFGCNPDVVDCACLAHDLGHPPFGHNGESVLMKLSESIGGFEGNAQTFRLLTRLEPKVFHADGRSAGVNLTRAALDAATKYPWTRAQGQLHPDGPKGNKFCVYEDDREVFEWLKAGSKAPAFAKPMEAQIMDLADDIGYSVHDVEDAIVGQSIDAPDLHAADVIDAVVQSVRSWYGERWDADKLVQAYERLESAGLVPHDFNSSRRDLAMLKNVTSNMIGRFANSVESATREAYGQGDLIRYSANVVIPEETSYEIMYLKGIAVYAVMEPREHEPFRAKQTKIIEDLVTVLMDGGAEPSYLLEPVFLDDWLAAGSDEERLRVAVDQVASLTDNSAISLHAIVCE
ncbi:deoxyguanosinetriphosphate triphosphohydrolase [Alloscardovia macacae]|uniref:Deoxyguanosinetriphosphate triphosphohydrolase-like protein n=1 Tax=Alloscardovia macacae TaxID=1160091 RepID=A0A261F3R0_9BIFI|nr:deoxyguanosinetriphosphate triphosphohydrolase [Alloscardovia macacae]OZG53752.1 deoxyguanosinetriphosphate triphosphohydrolase-like protein [Alloscardovia macacae]